MNKNLFVDHNQYAIVTGASSGLGCEYARQLLLLGFNVIGIFRRRHAPLFAHLAKYFPEQKVIAWHYDLSLPTAPEDILHRAAKYHVTVLVNNAGFGYRGSAAEESLTTAMNMIDVNVKRVHALTWLFIRRFRSQNIPGRIINIGSIAGFSPGPFSATYSATKSYVNDFSTAVNYELKRSGSKTRVVAICPGPVKTDFLVRATAHLPNPPTAKFWEGKAVKKLLLPISFFCRTSLQRALKPEPANLITIGKNNKIYYYLAKIGPLKATLNRRTGFGKRNLKR